MAVGEEHAPLLPKHGGGGGESPVEKAQGAAAGVDWRFARALARLLAFLRPWAALAMAALALLEILVTAQVGRVTGRYYRILLDRQWQAFWRATGLSALLYCAATLLRSTTVWLTQITAVRWRAALGSQLQQSYCSGRSLLAAQTACDNPDQRMAADLDAFAATLALVICKLAATPFKILLYGAWTASLASWQPLAVVLACFLLGCGLQRSVMSPIAARVARQERLEGDLRFAHARARASAEQTLLWGGGAAELACLQQRLRAAVANQARLAAWHWLLAAVTCSLEYAGAVLNFICVALPVAAGAFAGGGGAGAAAQQISNASFATLSLIYSLTEVLDLGDSLSRLAGLTARVAGLREALQRASERGGGGGGGGSRAKLLRAPWLLRGLAGGRSMQLSVHALGPEMARLAGACFAGAPQAGQLLAVCCIQGPVADQDAGAADAALAAFLRWQAAAAGACAAAGHWADAADPRTGFSLRGPRRQRWNEVRAAHWLLGCPIDGEEGICPRLRHPSFGTDAYLASLLTAAPLPVLLQALQATQQQLLPRPPPHAPLLQDAETGCGAEPWQLLSADPAPGAGAGGGRVLALEGFCCHTGQQQPVVAGLSLSLRAGGSLLVEGPSGAGKSTLLRALRGLWPCQADWLDVTPEAVFVAQRPLAAPGLTLREQVTYPAVRPAPGQPLLPLLQAAQLEHLLARVGGDWERPHDWAGELSLGELQRLAFARLLHASPALAVVDEPVSALGAEQGRQLLQLLLQRGIALLCTAQLGWPLADLFERRLTLAGDGCGGWRLE